MDRPRREPLTPRELACLALRCAGLTSAQVGLALYIQPGTVKNHLTRVFRKLDVRGAEQACVWWGRHYSDAGTRMELRPKRGRTMAERRHH